MSRSIQFRQAQDEFAAGNRDKPVKIEQRPSTDAVDGSGAPSEAGQWTTLADLEWMERIDLTAQERFAANQRSAAVDTIWKMTYRLDMDPEIVDVPKLRRLVYRGRTYDISGAALIGSNEGVELQTLARAGV